MVSLCFSIHPRPPRRQHAKLIATRGGKDGKHNKMATLGSIVEPRKTGENSHFKILETLRATRSTENNPGAKQPGAQRRRTPGRKRAERMAAKPGRSICLALALFEAARALQSGGPGPGFAAHHAYGRGQPQRQQEQQVGFGIAARTGRRAKVSITASSIVGSSSSIQRTFGLLIGVCVQFLGCGCGA